MSHVNTERSDREAPIPHGTAKFLHRVHQGTDPTLFRRLEDRQFLAMSRAYARSGGLASGDEIARRLRRREAQPLSTIARWIVDRRIVSLDWQSQMLIPLFQFDLTDIEFSTVPGQRFPWLDTPVDRAERQNTAHSRRHTKCKLRRHESTAIHSSWSHLARNAPHDSQTLPTSPGS